MDAARVGFRRRATPDELRVTEPRPDQVFVSSKALRSHVHLPAQPPSGAELAQRQRSERRGAYLGVIRFDSAFCEVAEAKG